MVHRMLLVRVGSRYVHLLKMFGALFTFASAFFVLSSAYELNQVLEAATISYSGGPMGDIFGALTAPIASIFLWLAFMVLGLALYRSDRTILPLEEDIEDFPTPSVPSYKRAGGYAQTAAYSAEFDSAQQRSAQAALQSIGSSAKTGTTKAKRGRKPGKRGRPRKLSA